MQLKLIAYLFLLSLVSCVYAEFSRGVDPYPEDNSFILVEALGDSLYELNLHERIRKRDKKINTDLQAFAAAKPDLREAFGEDEDILVRAYAFHDINGYWIVKGLLPEGFAGGTLVAVVDSRTGETVRVMTWR
ncbi:NTF2 fold immunity protein [Sanyastnella coralliicola]|uniref:NTF2 fold immunity protein n=1 Tax=Sanyastnella coralliicola TaxID=3069118 RepID=UPI0027B9C473|nr:NTF2 fold immunity protein [Longitalea sp. SCSIO 12813]